MKTLAEKQHFIGCDVSKSTLDLAIHERQTNPRSFKHIKVSNDPAGFKETLKWFRDNKLKKEDIVVAMEHTGVYSLAFGDFLTKKGIDFCMLHPVAVKRSCPQGRSKTDKDDSQYIADYVYTQREKLQPSTPEDPQIRKLRALASERSAVVRNRTALMNHAKAQTDPQITKRLKETIAYLSSHIKAIEKQIQAVIEDSPEIKENYELLVSIPGIGMINAVNTIISTGNFTKFQTARQYAKFCGVSPISKQSGTSIHGGDHVIKACHGEYKALLSQGAKRAVMFDPEIKAYYNKKIKEGKSYGCVLNAIKFKLICRMFAVIRRKKPYVDTQKYRNKKN